MKKCPKCGSSLRGRSACCANCGSRLSGGRFLKNEKRGTAKKFGIFVACVAIAVCICAIFPLFRNESPEQKTVIPDNSLLNESVTEEKQELLDNIQISEVSYAVEENDSMVLHIHVALPDYSQLLMNLYSEIEQKVSRPEAFEQELFTAVLAQTERSSEVVDYDLEINLDDYYPGKIDWSEEELNVLAKKVVLQDELEQFVINYLLQFSPVFEEE